MFFLVKLARKYKISDYINATKAFAIVLRDLVQAKSYFIKKEGIFLQKNTKLITVDALEPEKEKIVLAAEILKSGGVVAFPTETVYGLGANGLDGQAVEKIFRAKGRPSDNPLILHVDSWQGVEKLVSTFPKEAQILAEKFWPGPLTMVLPKKNHIPSLVTAGLDTVAVRIPDHPVALELIKQTGIPLAAPSANLSGKPSPTSASHVVKDLWGKIDMIIDGGSTGIGLESTVIDLTGSLPLILRPGGVTLEALEKELGKVKMDPALGKGLEKGLIPRAPGMKYTHYSPEAEVILLVGEEQTKIQEKMQELAISEEKKGRRVGLMILGEKIGTFTASVVKSMGAQGDLETVAANLYQLLREMDLQGIDLVLVEGVSYEGLGLAIMNRMEKAAGYQILRV